MIEDEACEFERKVLKYFPSFICFFQVCLMNDKKDATFLEFPLQFSQDLNERQKCQHFGSNRCKDTENEILNIIINAKSFLPSCKVLLMFRQECIYQNIGTVKS